MVSFVFSANQKPFVICTRVTSFALMLQVCTRVREELHSFLNQSELSIFSCILLTGISPLALTKSIYYYCCWCCCCYTALYSIKAVYTKKTTTTTTTTSHTSRGTFRNNMPLDSKALHEEYINVSTTIYLPSCLVVYYLWLFTAPQRDSLCYY